MLIHQKFNSKYLQMETDVYVIRPEEIDLERPLYLLYLLHGYTGNYSNWVRYTRIEKYVDNKNLVVVMPSGYNMYYTNAQSWYDYYSYYTKELPKMISEVYRLPFEKENTFIAGLSMGGYGALKAAYQTDNYAKVASFSGALNIEKWVSDVPNLRNKQFKTIFSNTLKKEDDLYYLVKQANKDLEVYLSCGTEDQFIIDSQSMAHALKEAGIKHVLYQRPGEHTWDFWDEEIKSALKFFLE